MEDGKADEWKGESVDCHRRRRNSPDSEEMGVHFHPSVFQISTDQSSHPFEVEPSRWNLDFGEHRENIQEARTFTKSEICGQRDKGRGTTLERFHISHHDECCNSTSNHDRQGVG